MLRARRPGRTSRASALAVAVVATALACWCGTFTAAATAASVNTQIAKQLRRSTGQPASQLEIRPVCGAAAPGTMRCLAQVVALRSTGAAAGLRAPRGTDPPSVRTTTDVAQTMDSAPGYAAAPDSGTPAFLQWAYDLGWLSQHEGSGDTVAIVDAYDDPNAYADLAEFRYAYGLWPCDTAVTDSSQASCQLAIGDQGLFQQYNQAGQKIDQTGDTGAVPATDSSGGWELEESLDLDAVSSLCPHCSIALVEANSAGGSDLQAAAAFAGSFGGQVSMSFGGDQQAGTAGAAWTYGSSASALAAAGDSGYPGAPYDATVTGAYNVNIVGYPAAYANVTAIGGSSLSTADNARGFSESTWSVGPGCWLTGACEGTESGCDTTQTTPSYQLGLSALTNACAAIATATGTTNSGGRAYNDASADADPNTGLEVYDSFGPGGSDSACDTWCLVGGTSLATPLTAAFEALTGTGGSSPAWAYADGARGLLNDITSGSDGSCPSGAFLICNAATGWDGPTGNGSISGDVAIGAPQAGGIYTTDVGTTSVTLNGGIYPNGVATDYTWAYGPSTSYGSETATVDLSASPALRVVSTTLTGLQPATEYHYCLELSGTVQGTDYETCSYDGDFTTNAAPSPPSQTQTTPPPGPSPSSGATGPSTGTASGTGASGTGANGPASATGAGSGTSGDSSTVSQRALGTVTGRAVVGGRLSVSVGGSGDGSSSGSGSGSGSGNAGTAVVRFYRCGRTCVLLDTHGARSYRPRAADLGRYVLIEVRVAGAHGAGGRTVTRWIGPITGPRAGVVTLNTGAHTASALAIRGTDGAALASARVLRRRGRHLTLAVRGHGRGSAQLWAYVVSAHGAVLSCTPVHNLRGVLELNLELRRGQSLRLVVVASAPTRAQRARRRPARGRGSARRRRADHL